MDMNTKRTTAGTLTGTDTAVLANGAKLFSVKSYDGVVFCGWSAGILHCSEDGGATWYRVGGR